MKGRIAILLVLLICLTGFNSFALESTTEVSDEFKVQVTKPEEVSEPSDKDVEEIVKVVKSKITIPDSYTKFTTGMNNYDGKVLWNLSWSSENDGYMSAGDGNIYVSVDGKGIIMNFSHYKYNREYDYQKKIPEISRQQAYDYAKGFISKVGSDILDELDFNNSPKNSGLSFEGDYYVNIYRKVNDVPFYENSISITLDGKTGEIKNYYRNWLDDLTFPKPEGVIDLSSAQEAYKEKIGLVLKYRKEYVNDNNKIYLEYSPGSVNRNAFIDALTGERINNNPYYDIYGYGGGSDEVMRSAAKEMNYKEAADMVQLTEVELRETKAIRGLITVEEAEKILRGIEAFGIDEEFKLSSFNLNRYTQEEKYLLNLHFIKNIDKVDEGISDEKLKLMIAAGEYNEYANVTMDGQTGEVLSFHSYGRQSSEGERKYETEELKKMVEGFLNEYKPDKFKQTKILEVADEMAEYITRPYPETDGFNYIRIVNGIPFEDNRLAVFFNKSTGKISSYSESWDEVEFISADNVIGNEKAHDVLFNDIGLELRYMAVPKSKDVSVDYYTGRRENMDVKLVYAPAYNKPVSIDANSGVVINMYNSEPFIEKTEFSFNDIEEHFAREAIIALSEIEVLEYEESYRPDDVIKQKELLSIVSKIRGDYYIPILRGEAATQAEVDRMYRGLEMSGIIDEEEKNPDADITREDAVKYLLRAASYRKFAELDQSLFNCDFKDKDEINPDLVGYVAISKVLNIINGNDGYFNPKGSLTRGEAAVMIYNYLKR